MFVTVGVILTPFNAMNLEKFEPRIIKMPPVLTVREFAACVNYHPGSIRRIIRSRQIKASGNPYRINPNELRKFNVDWEAASIFLTALREEERRKRKGIVSVARESTPAQP